MAKDLKAVVLFFAGLTILAFIFGPVGEAMTEVLGEHWFAIVFVVGAVIAAATYKTKT